MLLSTQFTYSIYFTYPVKNLVDRDNCKGVRKCTASGSFDVINRSIVHVSL